MPNKKKIAAAMAAVNAYLEQEAIITSTAPQQPVPTVTMWQLSGRQEIMQMSSLWQRRIVPLR